MPQSVADGLAYIMDTVKDVAVAEFAIEFDPALVRGMSLVQGAQLAADFTSQCAARTGAQDLPRREGVDFEPLLWRLGQAMASDENRRTIQ